MFSCPQHPTVSVFERLVDTLRYEDVQSVSGELIMGRRRGRQFSQSRVLPPTGIAPTAVLGSELAVKKNTALLVPLRRNKVRYKNRRNTGRNAVSVTVKRTSGNPSRAGGGGVHLIHTFK